MNDEPVAWIDPKELDMDVSTSVTKNKQFKSDIPLYVQPQKYCPSENNEAYEKGFIDGMAKQRDSAVQRFVEGGTPDSELAEHKRIIREQQAEIKDLKNAKRFIQNFAEEQHKRAVALESELDRAVELYTDKAIENEALKSDTIPYKDLHQVVKNVLAQPMRELSDEEILKVLTEDYHGLTIVNFARAILKKASEK